MNNAQRKILEKALRAHEIANSLLGVDDSLPYDMQADAYIDAFKALGGDDSEWTTWDDIRIALVEKTT